MTTRKPRRGEVDGKDYTFIDAADFERLKAPANCSSARRSTAISTPRRRRRWSTRIAAGEDMLFDIDWQGARQLKERLGEDVVAVFILPPDGKALERRLKTRDQDAPR